MNKAKKYLSAAGIAVLVLLGASRLSTSNSTPTFVTNVDAQVPDLRSFGANASFIAAAPAAATPIPAAPVAGVAPNGDPGGFEIDGNLRSSGSPSPITDWLDTSANSGIGGLLFENGIPKDPTVTFRLSDPFASNDDVFPGGAKVNDNPSTYTWLTNSANNKTDMNNVFVHISKDNQVPAHTWITASGDRYVTNGTAYIDFELNQAAVTKVIDNTTCSVSQQPCGYFVTNPAGKVAGDPLFATGGRTPNDLLITAAYGQGGSVATIIISQWANVGGTWQWKDITNLVPNSSAFVATYVGTTALPVPFGAFGGPSYVQNQFVEMSVDVTKLIGLAVDPCAGIIVRSVFVKTKTSTTSTATLMDFAAPVGVNFSAGFVVSATGENPACGTATGKITATFSGGTPGYQCKLDNGSFAACTSPQTYTGVAAGSHTVTVKDTSGCTKTSAPVTVTIPAAITASETTTPASCNGGNDGSVTVNVSGGTAPYSVTVNGVTHTGVTSSTTFPGLATGTYDATITDKNGCPGSAPGVLVDQSSQVNTSGTETDPNCSDGTGTMVVSFSGGTPGYTCSLDNGAFAACTSPATFNNLANGSHTVTVKDNKGCPGPAVTKTVTIPTGVNTSGTETDPNCSDGTGTMVVSFSGGTPGYTCSLDGGAFAACTSPATFNNLAGGSHTVMVKDNKACLGAPVTKTVTIPTGVNTSGTETDPNCSDGTGTMVVSFSGGTPGYTCSLDNGAFAACTSPATFNNLANGSHTVTVKDNKGCPGPAVTKTVTIPTGVNTSGTETDPNCSDGTGTMVVSFSGGTPGYTCSLDGGAFAACTSPATFNNLAGGSHTVMVKDNKACLGAPVTKTVTIPTGVNTSGTETDPNCSDGTGTMVVSFSGGTPGYTCSLDNGAFAACTSPATFNNLANGSHTVTVKDNKGCPGPAVTKTVTIPTGVNTSGTETDPNCSDGTGTMVVSFSGGTPGYTCSLDGGAFAACTSPATFNNLAGGSHTVMVKDNKACLGAPVTKTVTIPTGVNTSGTETDPNCSDGTGTMVVSFSGGTPGYTCSLDNGAFAACTSPATFNNLANGSHTVTVKDNKGCPGPAVTKTVTIPTGVTTSSTKNDPDCSTGSGSMTVTFSGGTPGYQCSLDGAAFAACTSPATFGNLTNGSHTVMVKDSQACLGADQTKTVTIPTGVTASGTEQNPDCSTGSGSMTVTFSGGTPGYQCSLDGAAFAACTSPATFGNLTNGSHTVMVKDSKGCPAPNVTKTVTIPAAITASEMTTPASCNGGTNGSVTVTVDGGTAPYSVTVNGVTHSVATSGGSTTFMGLASGTYPATISDHNLCPGSATGVPVGQASTITASETPTPASCYGGSDGTVTVMVDGGTAPYSVMVNGVTHTNVTSTTTFTGLASGTYPATISDAHSCPGSAAGVLVDQPAPITASETPTPASCNGSSDGAVTVSVSGGTSPYSVTVNGVTHTNVTSTTTFTGLASGTYPATISDAHSCPGSAAGVLVDQPSPVTLGLTQLACSNGNNGSISASFGGGTGPYKLQIDGGGYNTFTSPHTFSGLAPGSHTVDLQDANLCSKSAQISVDSCVCNPLSDCTPPYPFASSEPRTSIAFNESEVLRAFIATVGANCTPSTIQLFYNDEHALTLGIRRVIVKQKTAPTTMTTDYPVTPLATNPGSAPNPAVGSTIATGDQAGVDVSGRPMFPALFITDITTNPPNPLAGDWQYGGTAIPPHAVFGTWKAAVKTVDKTKNPAVVTVTPDSDPAKNNYNLGPGSDPVPAGLVNQGYGAEARWDISKLGLQSGHKYRMYFMVHDGDQNKTGGDSGQDCVNITMP